MIIEVGARLTAVCVSTVYLMKVQLKLMVLLRAAQPNDIFTHTTHRQKQTKLQHFTISASVRYMASWMVDANTSII